MSRGFAYSQIGGVLGRDPESRAFSDGTKVVNFSLAVERWSKDGNKTDWYPIVAFRETADWAEKNLRKGKGALVTGVLQTRSWDDKSGNKRTVTELVAYKIDFADFGSSSTGDRPTRQERATPPRQQVAAPPRVQTTDESADPFIDEPDIPF